VTPVENSWLSIGEVARASGLPVSALRFYDGAGVLVPASVDARTGYRRYAPAQLRDARLVARLRRVGMPLDRVRALLAGADPEPVLDAHLARLEDGLAAARRELSAVRTFLGRSEPAVTLTIPAAALDAVRYAVGHDPEYPALHGVLVEADGATLHAVATDRYRLAVVSVPADGATGRAFLPVAVVDELRATAGLVTVDPESAVPADGFPDWRTLEPAPGAHRVVVDGAEFRSTLAAGPVLRREEAGDTVVLTLGADGELTVGGTDGLCIGVNRDYLVDALPRTGQLTLELTGADSPLAIRLPDGDWSLLMPVRLPA
jgi:DNA polymerase-3 subunit beta